MFIAVVAPLVERLHAVAAVDAVEVEVEEVNDAFRMTEQGQARTAIKRKPIVEISDATCMAVRLVCVHFLLFVLTHNKNNKLHIAIDLLHVRNEHDPVERVKRSQEDTAVSLHFTF
jgi:hypothetical protein